MEKNLISAVAITLTVLAFLPYIQGIFYGDNRPHIFTWIIWGITTLIVFLAQLQGGGGAGAWPIGVSGLITMSIACIAFFKRGDITIKRMDWVFFLLALLALLVWHFSQDALWAVVILTIVDLLGFGPTLRKAYNAPYSESLPFFTIMSVRNFLSLVALEAYSVTTALFPGAIGSACVVSSAIIFYRRKMLPQ